MKNFKGSFKKLLKSFHNKGANRKYFTIKRMSHDEGHSSTQTVDKTPPKSTSLVKTCFNLIQRFFLLLVRKLLDLGCGKGKSMQPIKDLTLLDSATSLAYKIRTKKLTSVNVVKSYIERIKEVNPYLNCVVDNRFEEALAEAAEVDKLIESGQYTEEELAKSKPFLGIPVSTKDCISIKGMLQTAGLYKRRNFRAEQDAKVIALMRKAGAIPFALTNVSECCMWWESSNTVHGTTCNAYDTNRIVGGSSGGEGCLQSAAGSPIGIGSDIGGSIRMPAFFNGVFGHKPSKFIVSNEGQFPIPKSTETNSFLGIGPICRYAVDLKPMLKVLADKNADLLRLDEPVNLANLKIFYQEDDGGGFLISPVDNDIRKGMQNVVKHLESVLKIKAKKVKLEKLRQSTAIWFANMKNNEDESFEVQLANLDGKINPYLELMKWLVGCSNHTFIALMTALIDMHGIKHGSDKQKHLINKRDELLREVEEMLGNDGVFLYPTHPTVAPYHFEPIIRTLNFSYTGIINVLGLPATAIPLGIGEEGLPIGIQVVANVNQDRLCLAVATELERAFGGWVSPPIDA